ncbi:MAG: Fic family protein [Candidatus Peribacteria bacterium]|jgi:Fic family protein|nr:Fic family protein [Candidatus Peribacteria bacterium]
MVYYKKELPFSAQTVFEIHTLLGEKLLPKEQLGVVRNKIVEIGASTYTPLDNQHQLREEFDQFLKKLNAIHDPFEQSLFCLVFLSYFQLFMDGNKRVSRMIANLVLLKYNLPLISFLAVERKTFITAILAVYELNDVSLLSQIFVDNYLLNIERYE